MKNVDIPSNNNYKKIYNYYIGYKEVFYINIFKIIFRCEPKIIITQFTLSNLNIIILFLLRRIFKYKLIGWSHGWDRRNVKFRPKKSFKDKVLLYYMKNSDAMIFYSEDAKLNLSKYINDNKIFIANNTLDVSYLLKIKKEIKKVKKESLKKELNINTKYNLVFSSRLERIKNVESLLSVFELITLKLNNIKLHIIGSGPMENELKSFVKRRKIRNVIFHGSIYDEYKVGKILFISDLMIIPQWVGLSIIHGFCFECPLITFSKYVHPPEIIYLDHNKTGFQFDGYSTDDICDNIIKYLKTEKKHNEFKLNLNKTILGKASPKKMVDGVINAIKYCDI